MEILLVQDRAEIREKIVFFVESTFGARVWEASNLPEGLRLLKTAKPPIELAIFDLKINSPLEMKIILSSTQLVPTLFCADPQAKPELPPDSKIKIVDRTVLIETMNTAIRGLIEQGVLKVKAEDVLQCRIKTSLLISVSPLKGDIFIKLSENKYVKIFRQGDTFDAADLEKYAVKKKIPYLYIPRKQCRDFALKYCVELKKLLANTDLTSEKVETTLESSHETIQELTRQIGFTPEVQELVKAQIELSVEAMGRSPTLAEMLKSYKKNGAKYTSMHGTLGGYIACAIASKMDWASSATFHKLILAFFLHDITLDNQKLAAIDSLQELESRKSEFTEKEIKDFQTHPNDIASLVATMSEVPPDVDTIVAQHHEKPDGTGFPRGMLHSHIAPLASIFIVAHDLAKYTVQSPSFSTEDFLSQAAVKYNTRNFKKIVSGIEKMLGDRTLPSSIPIPPDPDSKS